MKMVQIVTLTQLRSILSDEWTGLDKIEENYGKDDLDELHTEVGDIGFIEEVMGVADVVAWDDEQLDDIVGAKVVQLGTWIGDSFGGRLYDGKWIAVFVLKDGSMWTHWGVMDE